MAHRLPSIRQQFQIGAGCRLRPCSAKFHRRADRPRISCSDRYPPGPTTARPGRHQPMPEKRVQVEHRFRPMRVQARLGAYISIRALANPEHGGANSASRNCNLSAPLAGARDHCGSLSTEFLQALSCEFPPDDGSPLVVVVQICKTACKRASAADHIDEFTIDDEPLGAVQWPVPLITPASADSRFENYTLNPDSRVPPPLCNLLRIVGSQSASAPTSILKGSRAIAGYGGSPEGSGLRSDFLDLTRPCRACAQQRCSALTTAPPPPVCARIPLWMP